MLAKDCKEDNIEENAKNKDKKLVIYLYSDMEENKIKEIVKLIEESEEKEKMSTIRERISKEFRNERKIGISQGIAQGITQAMMETIKNMLKYNEDEEKIMKYTNTKKEDIEKIRKELEKQTSN